MRGAPCMVVLCLTACDTGDCALADTLAALAGQHAEDCGVVAIDGNAAIVDTCAVAAWNAGDPFFAIYELQGIDSQIAAGSASDGTTLMFFSWDSDPSGGSNQGARTTEHVCGAVLIEPADDGHDELTCPAESVCSCEVEDCDASGEACCTP